MSDRLDAIVDEALDLEPHAWPAFLDGACEGDADLRAEAASLLAMHAAYPRVLEPGPPARAALPETIGRYVIHREIARGGMGVVYEASDDMLDRRLALKVLPARLAGDAEWLRRFGREATHLAALDHPHIANIYTLEAADDLHFLTMELLDGDPLSDRIDAGPIAVGVAVHLMHQVAAALEAVHRNGIVHCDLKPANILVSADERVTVIDFGLARRGAASAPTSSGHPTPDGDTAARSGTPGYMAPEQVTGESIDHRADVWAFGCVFYTCLTGRPAFSGDARERMDATVHRDPTWDDLPADVPESLRAMLVGCMEKEVDVRLGDMTAIRRALEAELGSDDGSRAGLDAEWGGGSDGGAAPSAHPQNLPAWSNAFVGREGEVTALVKRLALARLVTLTGAAGCGKTRLAVHAARQRLSAHADGVWFVNLRGAPEPAGGASVPGDERVARTIASAMDIVLDPTSPPVDALLGVLRPTHILLILDPCEHLLDACRVVVARLVDSCAGVAVLATSREALSVGGEVVHVVPPLPRPDPGRSWPVNELAEVGSVRLFLARAAESTPEFELTADNVEAVAALCRALEGIPLAIELAASRADVLSASDMVASLDQVTGDREGPGGESSIGALDGLIAWSVDLLSSAERTLFGQLSIFAGGWTLDAAQAVCAGDETSAADVAGLLTLLRRKSLVEYDVGARPIVDKVRFRMLEPVRACAARMLPPADREVLQRRHVSFFVELAEAASPHLRGAAQMRWLSTLDAEQDNLRAAMGVCLEAGTDPSLAIRFTAALEIFWLMRGSWNEAVRFGEAALARPGDGVRPIRGHALNAVALYHLNLGDPEAADRHYDEALAIGEASGDGPLTARSIHNKGGVALSTGRLADARRWFETYRDLMRADGDRGAEARALSNLGVVAEREGRLADAKRSYDEALNLVSERDEPRMRAVLLNNAGSAALSLGAYAEARRYLTESLVMHRDAGDSLNIASALNLLGAVAEEERDVPTAIRYFRESLTLMDELGNRSGVCTLLTQLGLSGIRSGSPSHGIVLLAATDALRERIGEPIPPSHQGPIGDAVEAARAALGTERFETEWARGERLAEKDAIRLALADPAPDDRE